MRSIAVVWRLSRAVGALPLATEEMKAPARLRARILAEATAAAPPELPRRPRIVRPPRPRAINLRPRLRFSPNAAAAVLAVAVLSLGAWNVSLSQQLSEARNQNAAKPVQYSMVGTGQFAQASASVVPLPQQDLVIIDFRQLPAPRPGTVYQLWLIKGSSATSAAVFIPDADGGKVLVLTRSLAGFSQIAVTPEPGPHGSPVPTVQPQLTGSLA